MDGYHLDQPPEVVDGPWPETSTSGAQIAPMATPISAPRISRKRGACREIGSNGGRGGSSPRPSWPGSSGGGGGGGSASGPGGPGASGGGGTTSGGCVCGSVTASARSSCPGSPRSA